MQLDEHPQTSRSKHCIVCSADRVNLITHRSSGRGRLTVNCTDVKNSAKVDACGRISGLNLWEGSLDEEEIQQMSLGCGMRDGDLMAWRSVTSGVIGDAHVHYDTSACRDVTGK